jgi:molybdopterin converting factor small subunit
VNIKILFFASLRDMAGMGEQQIEVNTGISVADLWQQVSADFELLPDKVLCAVNQEYVDCRASMLRDRRKCPKGAMTVGDRNAVICSQ